MNKFKWWLLLFNLGVICTNLSASILIIIKHVNGAL